VAGGARAAAPRERAQRFGEQLDQRTPRRQQRLAVAGDHRDRATQRRADPRAQGRAQANDVTYDENGLIDLLDRICGCHILEWI